MKTKKTFKAQAHRKRAQKHRDKREAKRKAKQVGRQTAPRWKRRGSTFNPLSIFGMAQPTAPNKTISTGKKKRTRSKK